MRNSAVTLVFTIAGILFTIVVLQNTEVVTYRALFWDLTMSRILILPIALLLGATAGFFLGRASVKKRNGRKPGDRPTAS